MRRSLASVQYVEDVVRDGSFPVVHGKRAAAICVDPSDHAGVLRAVADLQADVGRVSNLSPAILHEVGGLEKNVIVVGTIGKSALIDRLISEKKIDVSDITGKWESFVVQVVADPFPGVRSALLIAGSDKRGTIFGIYDLSEQIGVSPWFWWADVPVQQCDALFVKAGRYVQGSPGVKYRGIFLNDERPALYAWVHEKFGGFNHRFYTKVFELLLRLKGNFLWPAMWDAAFNDDDPLNAKLADEYGIVMGTSHHEPMLRAHKEWMRYGKGPWDYSRNAEVLHAFWEEGAKRNKDFESIISLAMRGDGDEPMSEEANVALLQKIVADQREIIAKQINPDVTKVPQLWACYKEVQEYYEKGMRVPDDVTLLWCDDNFGNIRRLPTETERERTGGAGIYYHFDYVGDPRSYKWINTVPITKIWEQMNLAVEYGATQIWIVNVGDLKPMEFPIEFFLRMAWRPGDWGKDQLAEYTRRWAEREFGEEHADEIAEIVAKYTKYNGRRKPELLTEKTFSQIHYREAERVLEEFKSIVQKAQRIYDALPENARDAFYQLVLYPTKASANVLEMQVVAGRHHLYAGQGRASTNALAGKVRELFLADAAMTDYYNRTLARGKWNHLMDQTHLGYTFWNESRLNTMPAVTEVIVPERAELGIAIEGLRISPWRGIPGGITLPTFDVFNRQRFYIDVFNRGSRPFNFTVSPGDSWIVVNQEHGTCGEDQRIWVSVDWAKVPSGTMQSVVKVRRDGATPDEEDHSTSVKVRVFNPESPARESVKGFVEANGYFSIEAEHFSRKVDAGSVRWERIADYGRTLSSMTIFPVTAASVMLRSVTPPQNSPCLEYSMYLFHRGKLKVHTIVAPTLNFVPGRGVRFGVSFDDQAVQIVDLLEKNSQKDWEKSVEDNVRTIVSEHTISGAGYHMLKIWMVDPGVVVQKLVIDTGGLKASYLGPPESFRGVQD
ncbi:MAG TPA: glycosyl hydrolase 115 family protein [Tepidisphaeraceae bacterium]|jgi:hypothetical protein|nr:glycosyl hydrolase 115 family protein [Tepidisphaeraceae bacterium]